MIMKLKFYTNPKLAKDFVHIGKNGQLRFKQAFAEKYGIQKGMRYQIGTDADLEKPDAFYLVKNENSGFKISYGNSSYHMTVKEIVEQLQIKVPCQLKYEDYKDNDFEAIKIILP
jgi:hypothetical protein